MSIQLFFKMVLATLMSVFTVFGKETVGGIAFKAVKRIKAEQAQLTLSFTK